MLPLCRLVGMSFVSSVSSFFGHIGHALTSPTVAKDVALGSVAITAVNPAVGALVQMVANAAYSVESAAQGSKATGGDKKSSVQTILDAASPVVLQMLGAAGHPVADPSALAPALDKLIDDVVAVFNTLGVFSHATAPTA